MGKFIVICLEEWRADGGGNGADWCVLDTVMLVSYVGLMENSLSGPAGS